MKTAKGMRLVFGYLGIFLVFEGLVTLLPILIAIFYPEEAICYIDFLIPGLSAIVLGVVLFLALIWKREKSHFRNREDTLLLVLIWVSACLIGAMPFLSATARGVYGDNGFTFSEAIFETVSGYSATGYTVYPLAHFVGEEGAYCPHIFMFHRALMQFVGGVGLVLIVASAISDRYNLRLYFAEGHNDKLLPNIGKSAKLIFGIYSAIILFGSFFLWLSGMDYFEAICQAAAAVATGGFATRSSGYTYYQSEAFTGNGIMPGNVIGIEIVTMVLMILGATNFVLHTFLFRGKIKEFCKDIEVKLFAFCLVFFILLSTVSTIYLYAPTATNITQTTIVDGQEVVIQAEQTGTGFWHSLRLNAFNIVSCMTTTGFTNFNSVKQLGEVAIFSSIIVMIIGGGMGSTAGAMKQYRVAILWKDFIHGLKYRFASNRLMAPNPIYRLGEEKEISDSEKREAHHFALLYLGTVLLGSLGLLLLPGISFEEGLFEFASALSGTGQSIIDFYEYETAANSGKYIYACYELLLWINTVGMFIGRLEILPVFYAFEQIAIIPIKERKRKRYFQEM